MHRLRTILGAFFVVAFAIFLVTSNVRWTFNTLPLYEFGFSRHQVARATGLTPKQLSVAAQQIRDYFNSADELLHVRVTVDGATRDLFDERETLHMRDVKHLLWAVYRVQEGTFLYLFLLTTLGFLTLGNDFAPRLRQLFVRGSMLTVALVGLVGIASMVGFGPLFTLFHRVSFSNDLWQLDRTSYLVRMFPLPFWWECTLLIALASIAEAVAVVVLLVVIRWWQQWRGRVAQSKAPQFV